MTLTKADLVQKIYQTHNLTKAQATGIVEAFLKISKDCLETASAASRNRNGSNKPNHPLGLPVAGPPQLPPSRSGGGEDEAGPTTQS